MLKELESEIRKKANKKKAKLLQRFFKTGKGEYAEGDLFLGIMVPQARKLVKKFKDLSLSDLGKLIRSKFHEERLICLLILVDKFQNTKYALSESAQREQKLVFEFYIKYRKGINNWDLVDLTAPKIVGAYLENKDKTLLYNFAKSKNIWERRIAMLSCFHYIYNGDCKDALKIADILKNVNHDLIQKAVGWMLREIGKRCSKKSEEDFLKKNYNPDAPKGRGSDQKRRSTLPRTMLRYAIERFPEKERKFWLSQRCFFACRKGERGIK